MFFDGANFKKTGKSGSLWACFGMVMDLGPKLRSYYTNMVQLYLIG
jgi:hypothetical protein